MWLDPVRIALDAAHARIDLFFRDDDVGWNDSRLSTLLDVFEEQLTPLDLAIIPQELTAALTATLQRRASTQPLALQDRKSTRLNSSH